jgi:hypothetical protein
MTAKTKTTKKATPATNLNEISLNSGDLTAIVTALLVQRGNVVIEQALETARYIVKRARLDL